MVSIEEMLILFTFAILFPWLDCGYLQEFIWPTQSVFVFWFFKEDLGWDENPLLMLQDYLLFEINLAWS